MNKAFREFPRSPSPAPSLREKLTGSVSLTKIEAALSAAIDTIRAESLAWSTDDRKLILPSLMDAIRIHEARLMEIRHTATRRLARVYGLGQWRPDPAVDEDDENGD